MSQTNDILIIVDFTNGNIVQGTTTLDPQKSIAMYTDCTVRGGLGTNELWVQVAQGDSLRWRAVAKQYTTADNQKVQAMITKVRLWGPGNTQNGVTQLDAAEYLKNWTAVEEPASGHLYAPDYQPLPANDQDYTAIKTATGDRNVALVQTYCHKYMSSECRVAYSFECSVFVGAKQYTVAWDPYVTITQAPLKK